METFPGSNVSLDGTINWEGARTEHNGGNTLGSMFTPRELTTDEQCLGGSSNDVAHCIKPTDDGGYIIAGWSSSTDGDASDSGNHGGGDAWIIKYSSSGSIMWQKCYGGSEWDCAFSIDQTADGGYIFAGSTKSSDGDVQSRSSKTETDEDIWVVKLTPSGAIVREQYIGDYGTERAVSVCNAGDGYAVAAYTDYSTFVVKLNTTLTSTWSRYYGEGGDSSITSIIRASDGNYVCAGYTAANGGDTEGNHGGYDAWVMKLNPNGEPLWHRCVGGTSVDRAYSIQQTAEGSYLVAGGTRSNSGDLAGKNPNYNDCCWVFRLDGTGNTVEWQNLINNGAYGCWGRSARVSSDTGYIVAGYVYFTSQNYNGFIAKFDSSGTLSWVRSPGGSGPDYMYSVCEANGSYVAAGETHSYNIPGHHGGSDAFVARVSGGVTPSPSPSPTIKKLTIENSKAEPLEFCPPDKTQINATIVAQPSDWTPTNLQWQVLIDEPYIPNSLALQKNSRSDVQYRLIKTFPSGTGKNIETEWDGIKDDGNIAEPGDKRIRFKAICADPNVTPAYSEALVSLILPVPKVKNIRFEGMLWPPLKSGILDQLGNIQYTVWSDSWKKDIPSNEQYFGVAYICDAQKAKIIVDFELKPPPKNKTTYTIWADRFLPTKTSKDVVFYPTSLAVSESTADFELVLPNTTQKLDELVWHCKAPFDQNERTMDEISLANPEAYGGIYIIMDTPKAEKDQRIEPLDFACRKAKYYNKSEEDVARRSLVSSVWDFLREQNFSYNMPIHTFDDLRGFELTKFMSDKCGDCKDFASFYYLCCCSLGIDIDLASLEPKKNDPNFETTRIMPPYYINSNIGHFDPTMFFRFNNIEIHEVAIDGKLIFDPTFKFFTSGDPLLAAGQDYMSQDYYVKLLISNLTTKQVNWDKFRLKTVR